MAGIDAERVLRETHATARSENLLGRHCWQHNRGKLEPHSRCYVRLQDGARPGQRHAVSPTSARVDLQTINRAARYGDPGEAHQYSAKTDVTFTGCRRATETVIRYHRSGPVETARQAPRSSARLRSDP